MTKYVPRDKQIADALKNALGGVEFRARQRSVWARNRPTDAGYRIRNAADDDGGSAVTEVLLYDEIGWFGITASELVKDLQEIDSDQIHVRINSPGGDVWDGIAITNALKRHDAKVTTFVDGIAASAASFIAMAGDEIVMSRNAEMMIHDAWGLAIGNAADMRELADRLDSMSTNIARIYADRAGGKVSDWRDAMEAETWYSDTEAVDAGLADRVETKKTASDKAKNRWDLSVFNHAGRAAAPAPVINKPAAEPPETPTQKEGSDMSDTLVQGLRNRLGGLAELTDDEVLERVDAAITTDTDDDTDDENGADGNQGDEAETDGDEADGAETAPGTVTVDEETLNALRRDAEAGREARAQQLAERRETLVNAAIQDGRVSPARKQDWLNTLKADPKAEASLAGLAKGLIPVDGPHGYAGGLAETGDASDADYYALFPDEKKVGA